jgi:hypothetical protein
MTVALVSLTLEIYKGINIFSKRKMEHLNSNAPSVIKFVALANC